MPVIYISTISLAIIFYLGLPLAAMVIAVNTRFLLPGKLEGYGYFIKEVFGLLTRQYPQHQFYFLFDRAYKKEYIFSGNVTPLVIGPPARHPLLWKYWYDVQVPRVLKKIKADVFVSPDGFCSLTTKVPQCLVVHDLGFLHFAEGYQKSHLLFYKHYTPKFLKKATTICTVSEFSKDDILKQYKVEAQKIKVVYSAAKKIFRPLNNPVLQFQLKEKYAGGTEYFIYVGAIHPRKNLINLLKAFSIFKKRQKSSMKLVLCGRLAWKNDAFTDLLQTYKYRQDVVLLDYIKEDELANLLGAAYALIYPSFFEGFGVPVLEAMQCDVPVVTSTASAMQEVAGDAALYFNPHSVPDIAERMMQVYKDENLRRTMIEKGRQRALDFSWQKTADLLWQGITDAVIK